MPKCNYDPKKHDKETTHPGKFPDPPLKSLKKVTLIIDRQVYTIHGKPVYMRKEEVTAWINPEEWKPIFASCKPDKKDIS